MRLQTRYNAVSGLNVFLASQIFILVDREVTGSFGITTVSTGTLWPAKDFDPGTGLASDQFTEILNIVIEGIDFAIRRNKGWPRSLGPMSSF